MIQCNTIANAVAARSILVIPMEDIITAKKSMEQHWCSLNEPLDYQWKEWWYQKDQWSTIQLVQHVMSTDCIGTNSFNIINTSLKSGCFIQCIYGFTSYIGDYFTWTVQSPLFIFFPRSKYTNLGWQLVSWLVFLIF